MSTLTPPPAITSVLGVGQGLSGPPGPAGPPGGSGTSFVTAEAVGGHLVLALNAAGLAFRASADVSSHALRVAGLSLSAAAAGDAVTVQSAGYVEHSGWTFTADAPVYLGLNGALVQAVPAGAAFVQVIGKALSSTRLLVALQPPIVLT